MEPLLNAAGEEYDEEHNKPHLVYRHERKKNSTSEADNNTEPCAASGNRLPNYPASNHCLTFAQTPSADLHSLSKPLK